MFCYALFLDNKQIKVYPYSIAHPSDEKRALGLAMAMRDAAKANGYHYTIEHFGASGVGTIVK